MTDWPEVVVPNGKYSGKSVEEVPSPYLRWLAENWDESRYGEVIVAAEHELKWRDEYDEHFDEPA